MIKERDPIDELEEKLEKHKKWANISFLWDGRTCFGVGVYASEVEAAENSKYLTDGSCIADLPNDALIKGYSKPNREGKEIVYYKEDVMLTFPVPIS